MRAALVGASDFEAGHFARHAYDIVVAMDAGYAHLRAAGAEPDIVLGDFDSLGYVPAVPDSARLFRYPAEKDASDMELACRAAAEAGADTLVLYGCLGRRLDHTIANLQVMLAQARAGRRVAAVGGGCAVAVLCGAPGAPARLAFGAIPDAALARGAYGRFISAFAWGGPAAGVRERGLKYRLEDARVPDDASLGLSNEFTGTPASIQVEEGSLLVTFPLAAWDYLADWRQGRPVARG